MNEFGKLWSGRGPARASSNYNMGCCTALPIWPSARISDAPSTGAASAADHPDAAPLFSEGEPQITQISRMGVRPVDKHAGRFHGLPVLEQLPQRHLYRVIQAPDRFFGYCTQQGVWLVPRNGLHTDQGSIPRLARPIIPSDAYWMFYIHDDLYQYGRREVFALTKDGLPDLTVVVDEIYVTREEADRWLFEGMRAENELHGNGSWLEAWLIYRKVNRWGFIVWNRHHDGRERSGFRWF